MSLPSNTASPTSARPPLSSSSSRQSLGARKETPANATSPRPPASDRLRQGQAPLVERASEDEQHRNPTAETVTSPSHDGAADKAEHDDGQEQQPMHPPFQPFFTLIEDAHTSEYHHPTVHYIFSDDDTDVVTEAALHSLEAQQDALPDSKKEQILEQQSHYAQGEEDQLSGARKTGLLRPPVPGVRDHFIILDVEPVSPEVTQHPAGSEPPPSLKSRGAGAPGGTKSMSSSPANQSAFTAQQPGPGQTRPIASQFRVTSAQSLAPTWQVLNTELGPAPTFENGDTGESASQGPMLKIRGTAGLTSGTPGRDRGGDRGAQRLEDMMDQFAKRMSELQMVIDAGEPVKPPGREQAEEQEPAENVSAETSKDEDGSAEVEKGDTEHS